LLDDASTPQDQAELPRQRRRLKGRGSELAKWLYLWIIGNAQQYPTRSTPSGAPVVVATTPLNPFGKT